MTVVVRGGVVHGGVGTVFRCSELAAYTLRARAAGERVVPNGSSVRAVSCYAAHSLHRNTVPPHPARGIPRWALRHPEASPWN